MTLFLAPLTLMRFDRFRRLRAGGAARERQQCDIPRPLDGHAQPPLVPRAHSRHAARKNFPALLHELRKNVRAFVVDEIHSLDAELAHLLLAEILPLPATRTAGPAFSPGTAARPAFTPWPASRTAALAAWAAAFPHFARRSLG